MGFLDFLFGNKQDAIKEFQSRGAVIIDVRTPGEYQQGAIRGSKNRCKTLPQKLTRLKSLTNRLLPVVPVVCVRAVPRAF